MNKFPEGCLLVYCQHEAVNTDTIYCRDVITSLQIEALEMCSCQQHYLQSNLFLLQFLSRIWFKYGAGAACSVVTRLQAVDWGTLVQFLAEKRVSRWAWAHPVSYTILRVIKALSLVEVKISACEKINPHTDRTGDRNHHNHVNEAPGLYLNTKTPVVDV